jgi:hypothetical protein
VPPGTYAATIRSRDVPAAAAPIVGTWTWTVGRADAGCVYAAVFTGARNGELFFGVHHGFTVDADGHLVFVGGEQGPALPGTYAVAVHGNSVVLRVVHDYGHGGLREFVFTARPWIRQS